MAVGIAAGEEARTVQLGESGIKYAEAAGPDLFARRPYRRITDALKKACKKAGCPVPLFFFMVERGRGERLHLHGAIILPSDPALHGIIREASLAAVGRDWLPTGKDKTQVQFTDLYDPVGWVHYVVKHSELTKSAVGRNLFAAPQPMIQAGQVSYEDFRKCEGVLLPGNAVVLTR